MVDTQKVPLNKDSLVPGALVREQDALRQLLINSKRADQLKNLYDHIIEVMDFLVVNYPNDALCKFEEVSYLIKEADEAKIRQFLKTQESKRYACHSDSTAKATKQFLERASAMISTSKKVDSQAEQAEEEGAADNSAPVCYMPDLVQDNKAVYQWANINFGEHVSMLLQKSMQNLAKTSGASKLRFWGKITGTERSYYIVEGVAEAPEPVEGAPADIEPRNSGANEFAYWVCNCPSENKWTLLPDLAPQDIAIARQVKFHFSGDLERRIITNPFLHKHEKFLLRAQIARITLSTTLVPKGMFRMQEESTTEIEENVPEEGPVPVPSVKQMCDASYWVHHTKSILNCNRVTLMEEEAPEGIEPEDFMKERMGKDPQQPRLKAITEDDKVKGNAPAWTIRNYGDMTEYAAANPTAPKQVFGVVVVRCNTWPGAYSFFTQQKQHMQVYLGDGLKFESKTYYPVHTPQMQADPVERLTYAEPNPTATALKRLEDQKTQQEADQEQQD